MTVTPPPRPIADPDRIQDAQAAIEEAVLQVIDDAVQAGWGEIEALEAVRSVAENLLLSIGDNEKLLTEIRERFQR